MAFVWVMRAYEILRRNDGCMVKLVPYLTGKAAAKRAEDTDSYSCLEAILHCYDVSEET